MRSGALIIYRRPKESERGVYLAIACDQEMRCMTHHDRGDPMDVGEFKGTSPEMRVICIVPVNLKNGRFSTTFAISAGYDGADAAAV